VGFRLSKWYMDCVADSGDAAILYWASLGWGALRVEYGAALFGPQHGMPIHRYTLRPGPEPAGPDGDSLTWGSVRLGASGSWVCQAGGIRRTLLRAEHGTVDWHCVCPKAHAVVRVDDRTVCGVGYVERLTTTVKPWSLPLDELRWGRFLSHDDTMVWIGWCGAHPQSWIFVNGREESGATITPESVTLPQLGLTLALDRGRVLRTGRLLDTALRPVWAAAALMPRWRVASETKWVARGTVTRPERTIGGWVVHEVVRWA